MRTFPKLDQLLKNPACKGAFQLGKQEVAPLKAAGEATFLAAQKSAVLWAALNCVGIAHDVIIAKRESGTTLVSAFGGVIVEASGPLNIGMFRASLKGEERIVPEADAQSAVQAGTRALLNLVDWIERIEAERAISVSVGDATLHLSARKGRFGVDGSTSAIDVARAILAANINQAPVSMTYDDEMDQLPQADCAALDLLGVPSTKKPEWLFDATGTPFQRPADMSRASAFAHFALYDALQDWSNGETFTVSILHQGTAPAVIAESNDRSQIRIACYQRDGSQTLPTEENKELADA